MSTFTAKHIVQTKSRKKQQNYLLVFTVLGNYWFRVP